jgi:hypothetical protein
VRGVLVFNDTNRQPVILPTAPTPEGCVVGLSVGVRVGSNVGSVVGLSVGELVGTNVGPVVGLSVGVFVGSDVGLVVGLSVGVFVGSDVGPVVGLSVGVFVGSTVGVVVGLSVGKAVGSPVGRPDGAAEEIKLGATLGLVVVDGLPEGNIVAAGIHEIVGDADGASGSIGELDGWLKDGTAVGANNVSWGVGCRVGSNVGLEEVNGDGPSVTTVVGIGVGVAMIDGGLVEPSSIGLGPFDGTPTIIPVGCPVGTGESITPLGTGDELPFGEAVGSGERSKGASVPV